MTLDSLNEFEANGVSADPPPPPIGDGTPTARTVICGRPISTIQSI